MSNDNNACPYNKAVICGPRDWQNKTAKRECTACGWDPDVAKARLEKFCRKHHIAYPLPEIKKEETP